MKFQNKEKEKYQSKNKNIKYLDIYGQATHTQSPHLLFTPETSHMKRREKGKKRKKGEMKEIENKGEGDKTSITSSLTSAVICEISTEMKDVKR